MLTLERPKLSAAERDDKIKRIRFIRLEMRHASTEEREEFSEELEKLQEELH